MNKELALQTMMLLSALESWAFSKSDRTLPDHLLEDINNVQEQLKVIVLDQTAPMHYVIDGKDFGGF